MNKQKISQTCFEPNTTSSDSYIGNYILRSSYFLSNKACYSLKVLYLKDEGTLVELVDWGKCPGQKTPTLNLKEIVDLNLDYNEFGNVLQIAHKLSGGLDG